EFGGAFGLSGRSPRQRTTPLFGGVYRAVADGCGSWSPRNLLDWYTLSFLMVSTLCPLRKTGSERATGLDISWKGSLVRRLCLEMYPDSAAFNHRPPPVLKEFLGHRVCRLHRGKKIFRIGQCLRSEGRPKSKTASAHIGDRRG